MNKETEAGCGAAGAPVERPVRPCAWIAPTPLESLRSGSPRVRVTTELRRAPDDDDVPLYDQAALDAAVAAERERWRALLEARAAGCERAAENTEDPKFDAMARVLMSARDDGSKA